MLTPSPLLPWAAIQIVMYGSQANPQPGSSEGCRGDAVYVGGQCLIFSTEEASSWQEAKEACSSQHGQLASLNDPQAVLAYTEEHYQNVEFWAGGSDITTEGTWTWITGEPLARIPWSRPACGYGQQPDNLGGHQDCLVVNWCNGGYDDQQCTGYPHRYICEDVCKRDAVYVGGQCLRFSTEEASSWQEAKEACSSQHGQLASLNDPQAVLAYTEEHYHNVEFWAGGSDITTEGTWTWITGEPLTRFPWSGPACTYSHQPDNQGGHQDCLVVNWVCGGYDDQTCDRNPHRYICEDGAGNDHEAIIGSQHLVFSQQHLTWQDAVSSCESNDGKLATIEHPNDLLAYIDKQGLVVQGDYFTNIGQEFWVGGSDSANEGRWVWINGEAFDTNFPWSQPSDNSFGATQPDNYEGNQDCLSAGWQGSYDDQDCNRKMRFICEKC